MALHRTEPLGRVGVASSSRCWLGWDAVPAPASQPLALGRANQTRETASSTGTKGWRSRCNPTLCTKGADPMITDRNDYLPATTSPAQHLAARVRGWARIVSRRWRGDVLADWRATTPPAPHTHARARRRVAWRLSVAAFLAGVATGAASAYWFGGALALMWVLGGVS